MLTFVLLIVTHSAEENFDSNDFRHKNFQKFYCARLTPPCMSSPLDSALRLLKDDELPKFCQSCEGAGCEVCDNTGLGSTERFHQEHEPMSFDDMESYYDESHLGHIGTFAADPVEIFQDIMEDTPEGRRKQTNIMGATYRGEPTFNLMPLAGAGRPMINPHAEIFRRGNPMDLAMQLLKMPMYETGIPGIRFTTQSEDEADWEKDPTFFGSGAPADAPEDNTLIDFIDRMTPNEFLSLLPRIGESVDEWEHTDDGEFIVPQWFKDKEKAPTPREAGDFYYRDLMDRAQAGEDIHFGMPYLPAEEMDRAMFHDGRHRMEELVARGYGDTLVPVRRQEL